MAVSNGYIYVNDAVTPPVGISLGEIASVLHAQPGEELASHANIKMWSKYKPFRSASFFKTVAETQTAAKAADYGLVDGSTNEHALLYTGGNALRDLYNHAMLSKSKWKYLKPRGLSYTEWARTLDFAGYNHNAVNPPIKVTFTPDANDRTGATMTFQYPENTSAYDLHIRDFQWYVASVQGGLDNWKYGILQSESGGNVQSAPDRIVGSDIYDSSGNYINNGSPRIGWEQVVTIRRGRKRFFVPFITRLREGNGSLADGSVYLPTDSTDKFSLPQSVTTYYMADVQVDSAAIHNKGSVNWSSLISSGGSLSIDASVTGTVLHFEKAGDDGIDIDFRLASNYGDGTKVTAKVTALFFSQHEGDEGVTNYYTENSEPSTAGFNHERLTFTITQPFLARGTELYLQVYDKNSGILLDEYYIDSVPQS